MLIAPPEVRLPRESDVTRVKRELTVALGPSKVIEDREGCERFARDESEAMGRAPDVVVVAERAEDVATTLAIADRCDVPVTPRAAGTGRTGGAVPVAGGIVLATHALNKVKDVDRKERLAVVEPGVILGDLHALVEREGLFYPPDPNSQASCMIGGNLAENAGGPRAFKYGVTREYVLGVDVALMGGRTLRCGRRTVKGVTGYDVTALFVGSEGTLCVFTEATLRLVSKPPHVATTMALFADLPACAAAVAAIIEAGLVPRCLELLDAATLGAVRANKVAIDPRANAMLLIEVDGEEKVADAALERLGEVLSSCTGVIDVVVAQDGTQRARLWEARRSLSHATRKLARYKLSEDVVVPRSKIVPLLEEVARIGDREKVQNLTYGHAGDGNLHVNFLWNDDSERPAVDRAIDALMRTTVALRNSTGMSLSRWCGAALAAVLAVGCADDPSDEAPEAGFVGGDASGVARGRRSVATGALDAGWVQSYEVYGGGGGGGYLGSAVALSGATAVVGATGFIPSGGAYVYRYDAPSAAWVQEAFLQSPRSPDAGSTDYAWAVAADGDTIVIGALIENAVYVYRQNGTTVSLETVLDGGAGTGASFGQSVAISGDTILVGAPGTGGAYVYTASDAGWSFTQSLPLVDPLDGGSDDAQFFGSCVAVSGDTAVVAASNQLVAEVFVRDAGAWSLQQALALPDLTSPAPYINAELEQVAVLGDTLLVGLPWTTVEGLPNRGVVEVFQRSAGAWTYQTTLAEGTVPNEAFGYDLALLPNLIAVSAPESVVTQAGEGSVYLFEPSNDVDGGWALVQQLLPSEPDPEYSDFGHDLTAASNTPLGDMLLVGAFGTGVGGSGVGYFESYGTLNGGSCTTNAECGSNYCVGGVCCVSTCTGGCAGCTAEGTCVALAAGTAAPTCAPYLCQGDQACPVDCASDADCALGTYCSGARCVPAQGGAVPCDAGDQCLSGSCVAGACLASQALGAPCLTDGDCASTFCADGVCCNAPCNGQCEACDEADAGGTCLPVNGAPRGVRTPCGGEGACAATCNGAVNEAQCGYPSGTPCGCSPSGEISATCAEGACVSSPLERCAANLVCSGATCKTSCESQADCVAGFRCGADHSCAPLGSTCVDAGVSRSDEDGGLTSCGAFACDDTYGTCFETCSTSAECLAPNVCDSHGQCGAPPATTSPVASCDVTAAGAARGGSAAGALFALAMSAVARRRRRRR